MAFQNRVLWDQIRHIIYGIIKAHNLWYNKSVKYRRKWSHNSTTQQHLKFKLYCSLLKARISLVQLSNNSVPGFFTILLETSEPMAIISGQLNTSPGYNHFFHGWKCEINLQRQQHQHANSWEVNVVCHHTYMQCFILYCMLIN
jgi:hypothetical protein